MPSGTYRWYVLVVGVIIGILCLVGAGTTAVAADTHEPAAVTVTQNDACVETTPINGSGESIASFYDYRNPETEPSSGTFSSHGTTAYQQADTSLLMVYDGPDGLGLVIVHDRYEESDGTDGGAASFHMTGLPSSGEWVVEDDDYDGQDDRFDHGETESDLHWTWTTGRTDGAAYSGLGETFEISIDPAWGDDAELDMDDPSYSGNITEWQVISATDDGFERQPLPNTETTVTLGSGTCNNSETQPPQASLNLSHDTAEVGETTVTLDASGSSTAGETAEYQWDLTESGTVDQTTNEPTIDHIFDDRGPRNITVTIVDDAGRTDTANAPIDVVDTTPPSPNIQAPDTTRAGTSISLSGAESSDNHHITTYEWAFGDGTSETGETVEHHYEEDGSYEVTLQVIDDAGNDAVTTHTIDVTGSDPTAVITAPDTATRNETVTFDASESDVSDDAVYEWTIGSQTATTTTPTYTTSFDSTGTIQASVTITDNNETDTANTSIVIEEPLTADIAANRTAASVGDPIAFSATGSSNHAESYQWSFDDGTQTTGEEVTHAYHDAGEYTVTLHVTDGDETATDSVTVDISETDSENTDGDENKDGDDPPSDTGGSSGSPGGGSTIPAGSGGTDDGATDDETDTDDVLKPPGDGEAVSQVAAVEHNDGAAIATAENVTAGETILADVTIGDPIELDAVAVQPAEDLDRLTIIIEPTAETVPGRFAESSAVTLEATGNIDEVTYQYSIPNETLTGAGVAPDNLSAYALTSEWDQAPTEVYTQHDTDGVTVTTVVEDTRPVGVGATGSVLFVRDIETGTPVAGRPLTIAATVQNTGTNPITHPLRVTVDQQVVKDRSMDLPPGNETTLTTTTTPSSAGNLQLQVGATERSVTVDESPVVSVGNLTVSTPEVAVGDTVTIEATLTNTDVTAVDHQAELRIDGAVNDVTSVTIPADDSSTVVFREQFDQAGTYELHVGSASQTVTVHDNSTSGDERDDATAAGNGFGLLVAILAVVLAGAGRRLR